MCAQIKSYSYPYTKFGYNLWRLREVRGKSTNEVATYLNISFSEYRAFEMGKQLPSGPILLEISRFLDCKISKLKHWLRRAESVRQEGKVSEELTPYIQKMEAVTRRLEQIYYDDTGVKLSEKQKRLINKLQNKLPMVIDLPVLPMNYVLIVDALNSPEAKCQYLHEYPNFIVRGESLAGFISRDLYLAPMTFYLANLFYYPENPFKSVEACFNQITIEQFKEILLIATAQYRVFEAEGDMPSLQKHADFSSLACLFVRLLQKKLKDHPPKNINFDHLYQACLLQGIGQYVIFDKLKPSIMSEASEVLEDLDDPDIYLGLDKKLFNLIVWELHAVVSAIIGANWNFPKEVTDIVLAHHDHPVKDVSGTCAMLKMVNFFVDRDFPKLSKDELKNLLLGYSQVKIPLQYLFDACCDMANLKTALYERSSALLENTSQKLVNYAKEKIKNSKNHIPHAKTEDSYEPPFANSDFRFDYGYQSILKTMALERFETIRSDFFYHRSGEPMANVGERSIRFNLRLKYALIKDLKDVAEESNMALDEVRIRLNFK